MPAQNFTPEYITYEDVLRYTRGKITEGAGSGDYSADELNTLCAFSESRIEQEIGRIYKRPFQTFEGSPFANLPSKTRMFIVNLCIWRTVMEILDIDFGSSSSVFGDNFRDDATYNYKKSIYDLTHVDKRTGMYLNAPLPGMAINPVGFTNQTASRGIVVDNPMSGGNYITQAAIRQTSPTAIFGYGLFFYGSRINGQNC